MVELNRISPPACRPPAAASLHSPQPTTSLTSLGASLVERISTPRPPTQALIHSPQPSTSFTPTVPVQPPRQSSRQRGPPTQLGDYDFGCEEDISHRRSRRVKAADFFSQAPDRPDSPPSALRAFQPPSPANHTDIITSSHSSPQLQPNPTPTIPHPGLVFEQSATRIRTSHS